MIIVMLKVLCNLCYKNVFITNLKGKQYLIFFCWILELQRIVVHRPRITQFWSMHFPKIHTRIH